MSALVLNPSLNTPPCAPPSASPPAPPNAFAAAPAPRLARSGGWQPAGPRPAAAALALGLHLLAGLALLQAGRMVATQLLPKPVQISLLETPQRPPEPPQSRPASPQALPLQPVLAVPLPEFETAPSPRVAPALAAPAPVAAAAPHSVETAVAQIAPQPPQPPQPKTVPASALRYRTEPAIEVPLLSRRAGEHGRVALRVVFDTQGRPNNIQLQQSSGFARLDAQAVEAMRMARIAPIVEDGRPIEVMAVAWLEYELD